MGTMQESDLKPDLGYNSLQLLILLQLLGLWQGVHSEPSVKTEILPKIICLDMTRAGKVGVLCGGLTIE